MINSQETYRNVRSYQNRFTINANYCSVQLFGEKKMFTAAEKPRHEKKTFDYDDCRVSVTPCITEWNERCFVPQFSNFANTLYVRCSELEGYTPRIFRALLLFIYNVTANYRPSGTHAVPINAACSRAERAAAISRGRETEEKTRAETILCARHSKTTAVYYNNTKAIYWPVRLY